MSRGIKFYLYKIATTPPQRLARTAYKKFVEHVGHKIKKQNALSKTYQLPKGYPGISHSNLNADELDVSALQKGEAMFLSDMYLQHRFDLLGSGWVKVSYDLTPLGVGGHQYDYSMHLHEFNRDGDWLAHVLLPNYVPQAKEIWRHIDPSYEPIDWQLDFKSGYRWDAKKWYLDQKVGAMPGVDIKVPWELARMQHLPQMACFAAKFADLKPKLIKEYKNQVLDFMATNPVRMGVNWRCTMDVAIRAANILLAFDLFRQIDDAHVLDNPFQELLAKYMYEHGRFIVENFEWSEVLTSNHYLSNICGLLFIAAYLESTTETDAWLAFSLQELIIETEKQFQPDGSNFEGSTSYHRLSGEMVIFTTALAYGVAKEQAFRLTGYRPKQVKRLLDENKQVYQLGKLFRESYLRKLCLSGRFSLDITKPSGDITQFGDNDSGRFCRLSPNGSFLTKEEAEYKYVNLSGYGKMDVPESFWDEDSLSHATFISAIHGLFDCKGFEADSNRFPLEKSVVRSLSRFTRLPTFSKDDELSVRTIPLPQLPYEKKTKIELPAGAADNLQLIAYRDFGLYIFKSDRLFLSIMAGHNGQDGNAGHAHNDKLSFELQVDQQDKYMDPGTYIYTALPDERNRFRSVRSHNTIIVNNEEQNQYLTLFSMKNETSCSVLEQRETMIKVNVKYRDIHHVRTFSIENGRLWVIDECNKPFELNFYDGKERSNGYGKLIKIR